MPRLPGLLRRLQLPQVSSTLMTVKQHQRSPQFQRPQPACKVRGVISSMPLISSLELQHPFAETEQSMLARLPLVNQNPLGTQCAGPCQTLQSPLAGLIG